MYCDQRRRLNCNATGATEAQIDAVRSPEAGLAEMTPLRGNRHGRPGRGATETSSAQRRRRCAVDHAGHAPVRVPYQAGRPRGNTRWSEGFSGFAGVSRSAISV